MKTFLSIDWDYFIGATNTQRTFLFPDGGSEGMPEPIRKYIWDSHYQNPELKRIKVDPTYRELLKMSESFTCPACIRDSHKYAFDFIMRHTSAKEEFRVINVDFHHDCYSFSWEKELTCGNWVVLLKNSRPNVQYVWVSRKDSAEEEEIPFPLKRVFWEDFINLMSYNSDPDYLFICRSATWSPPHLDPKFVKLIKQVRSTCCCEYEKDIYKIRKYSLECFPEDMYKALNNRRKLL